ncbi:hypothetical protein K458DRAFT_423837 [Lentithecium fluviatile CBS 122367]|uniref:Uncharacterized protein n=1 Tax=Lentithecium fluviatile CBS 122367 TaxID=1168545 RepID=A0A6G1IH96_9PLEO|nr:hypothetical protein K458DRAFT_423837 [Lentithecium fluviatile CBS 122367]
MSVSRTNLDDAYNATSRVKPSKTPQPLVLVRLGTGVLSHWGIFLSAGPNEENRCHLGNYVRG